MPIQKLTTLTVLSMQDSVKKLCTLPFKEVQHIVDLAKFIPEYTKLVTSLSQAEQTINKKHIQHAKDGSIIQDKGNILFCDGCDSSSLKLDKEAFLEDEHSLDLPNISLTEIKPFLSVTKDGTEPKLTAIDLSLLACFWNKK